MKRSREDSVESQAIARDIEESLQYEHTAYTSFKDKFEHLEKGKLIEKGLMSSKRKVGSSTF